MSADRFDPGDLCDPDWVLWARLAVALVFEAEREGHGWVERAPIERKDQVRLRETTPHGAGA